MNRAATSTTSTTPGLRYAEDPARHASLRKDTALQCTSGPASSRAIAFTLPEVLVSLALVGLVIPAVMRGVSLALAASDDARKRIEAVGLAESKLEELAAAVTASSQGSSSAGNFGAEHPRFRWDATATTVETDLTEIRVNVRWTARGVERSVALSTFAYAGISGTTSAVASASGGAP